MLARRLEELRVRWRLTKKEMAQKLGISFPYYSEIITGKKTGRRKVIDFAELLQVSVEWLTGDQILIPVLAEVTAGNRFHLQEKAHHELIDITHLPGINKQTAMHHYALRIRGDNLVPFHKDGDILIIARNIQDKIRHGDMVVYHTAAGSWIRSLDFRDNQPKLRDLDLTGYFKTEQLASLSQLDKVVFVISS
ncbi:MAG: helix-turn-helix domain-containing protein [Deltaproteobacteria bacterium]|nr:MAG: helix-turn-helix domain-containing protein [Deltaproteobacteria bacterium]